MGDERLLADYFKLAEAAQEFLEAHADCDDKLWEHYWGCPACNPSKSQRVAEFVPEMRLNCETGTSLQYEYARSERRQKKADADLAEYQFSVAREMRWADVFAYAVGALKGEWIAIEIRGSAKTLSEQAISVFTKRDLSAVPAQVACSILSEDEHSIVLIIRAAELRDAYERTRLKIAPRGIAKTAVPSSQVNWDILPAGSRGSQDDLAKLARQLSPDAAGDPEIAKIVVDRIEFFESLKDPKPQRFIRGRNSFSSYFGVQFSSELVAFENPREGNAIYIVFGKWEEISKFSKSDLLATKDEDRSFVRVVHAGDWKTRFREQLLKIRGAKE
jgi:hypothetical protein